MDREDAEKNLLQRPLGAIIAQDVLIVLEKTRERVVLDELILDLLPQPLPFPFFGSGVVVGDQGLSH